MQQVKEIKIKTDLDCVTVLNLKPYFVKKEKKERPFSNRSIEGFTTLKCSVELSLKVYEISRGFYDFKILG